MSDATDVPDDTPGDSTEEDTVRPLAELGVQVITAKGHTPLAGVALVWTPPGGRPVQLSTDLTGSVRFTGIDWSLGTATLLARLDGHATAGFLISEDQANDATLARAPNGDQYLLMEPLQPETIEVSGSATGLPSANDHLVVAPDLANARISEGLGPKFELNVEPNAPFNWTAFTWKPNSLPRPRRIDNTFGLWATGSMPGAASSYVTAIDLVANAAEPQRVSGSFPLFASPLGDLEETCVARVFVLAHESLAGLVGFVSRSQVTEGNVSAEYDLEWLAPAWATSPSTRFDCSSNTSFSAATLPGWPKAGNQDVRLPAPPVWVSPVQGETRAFDEPLEWTNEEPELFVTVLFREVDAMGQPLARLFLPRGSTGVTLSDLLEVYDLFGAGERGEVKATVLLCGLDPEVSAFTCAQVAASSPVTILPPAP